PSREARPRPSLRSFPAGTEPRPPGGRSEGEPLEDDRPWVGCGILAIASEFVCRRGPRGPPPGSRLGLRISPDDGEPREPGSVATVSSILAESSQGDEHPCYAR